MKTVDLTGKGERTAYARTPQDVRYVVGELSVAEKITRNFEYRVYYYVREM